MEEFIPAFAYTDDNGHWYVIPSYLKDSFILFHQHLEEGKIGNEDRVEFERLFNKYRTGGDINLVQLYIKS